jgi:hypothetical protein
MAKNPKENLWSPTNTNPEDTQVIFRDDFVDDSDQRADSLPKAILGGFLGTLPPILLWASLGYFVNYRLDGVFGSPFAIFLGLCVGKLTMKFGHGEKAIYGWIGAFWAFIGISVALFLITGFYFSKENGMDVLKAFSLMLDMAFIREFMFASISLRLWWFCLAIYIAFRNSYFRNLSY